MAFDKFCGDYTSCTFLRTLLSSVNKLPCGGRLLFKEVKHRRWILVHRQGFRFKTITIVYFLGIINGVILDSLIKCPLGALLVLNFIALINDELTGVVFKLVTRVFCPTMNFKLALAILHDSRNITNGLFIYMLISVTVMVSFMMNTYYTQP